MISLEKKVFNLHEDKTENTFLFLDPDCPYIHIYNQSAEKRKQQ
jgi:hypothetical protein